MPFLAHHKFASQLCVERPKRASWTNVIHARLLEAHPGAQPAQELVGLGKSEELIDDLAIHQREVTRVERHRHVRNAAKDAIKALQKSASKRRALALAAAPVHDVIAFAAILR